MLICTIKLGKAEYTTDFCVEHAASTGVTAAFTQEKICSGTFILGCLRGVVQVVLRKRISMKPVHNEVFAPPSCRRHIHML